MRESNSNRKLGEFNPLIESFNYFVINPNASDFHFERRWPVEYFIQLVQEIRKLKPELFLVIIGINQVAEYISLISKDFVSDNRGL